MKLGGQHHAPATLHPRKRPCIHSKGGRVETRDGLDGCRKISPPPGFDPRTVQSVASCYTDYAIPANNRNEYHEYFLGGKSGRYVRLTTLSPSCAGYVEIREPQLPGNLLRNVT